jgi:hypothetical protein
MKRNLKHQLERAVVATTESAVTLVFDAESGATIPEASALRRHANNCDGSSP